MSDQSGARQPGESLSDRAARIARERKAQADRRDRLESSEALQALSRELETLVRLIDEQGQAVRQQLGVSGGVEAGPTNHWAVQFGGLSTTVVWDQRHTNSVRDALLMVRGWNRNHSFAAYSSGNENPASEQRFQLDVMGDGWGWREVEGRLPTDRVIPSAELADDHSARAAHPVGNARRAAGRLPGGELVTSGTPSRVTPARRPERSPRTHQRTPAGLSWPGISLPEPAVMAYTGRGDYSVVLCTAVHGCTLTPSLVAECRYSSRNPSQRTGDAVARSDVGLFTRSRRSLGHGLKASSY